MHQAEWHTLLALRRTITVQAPVYNAETNALLREQKQLLQKLLAKEYGISKDDIGNASRDYARDYARDYFRRTGRDAYTFWHIVIYSCLKR